MRASYKVFRGTFASWEILFGDAADFASSIGPDRLISISHSEDNNDGVVTVWYWQGTPDRSRRSAAAVEDIDREIEENPK